MYNFNGSEKMERKGIIRHLKVLKRKGKVKKWSLNRYSSPGFYFYVMVDEFREAERRLK